MRFIYIFLCCAISIFSLGQNLPLSEKLQTKFNSIDSDEYIRIRIEFDDNVNCSALSQEFKNNQVSLDKRSKKLINSLMDQSKISQHSIIEFLNGVPTVKELKPFWIVNIVVCEIQKSTLMNLNQFQNIALIDLENNKYVPNEEFQKGTKNLSKSIDGVEPGLKAINAPAMWALGYTGRGRTVYDYDTGVWPTHPAFSNRFLANHYPMNQCWYGYFSDLPSGQINAHGTHTLGTIAGLDENNNDTIGVAFKSYWIANDFVTSTVAALPPITDMIGAFEWALNPDGDISTTHDIPDVINNSWRWYDGNDTLHCGGYIVNLMNAIEAAGIANVFSGGNSGPTNTSVNSPQRINTSEVNTFSVGAVNGNVDFPHPITDFSTRGPIQCPGTGSLLIHPEVVAPGYSVRSAWDTDSYNSISGTSMAAPHVSGALLLLKEAFPYLSGEDLLWALYLTAIDLGDTGEDNVYGNGLIDVYQAYLYLASTNTPVDPNNVLNDLEITLVNPARNGIICGNQLEIEVQLKNLGATPITSVDFETNINGEISTISWTGTLNQNQAEIFTVSSGSLTSFGNQEINISSIINGAPNEYDIHNNKLHFNIDCIDSYELPFTETFEAGFTPGKWFISNPDASSTWDTTTTISRYGSRSAKVELMGYSPRNSQLDHLTSGEINLTNTNSAMLKFDFAYQRRHQSDVFQDTFAVKISTDCGLTYDLLKKASANNMITVDGNLSTPFVPSHIEDWIRDSIDLNNYIGNNVIIQFETINRQGNNVYIDNIGVYENEDPLITNNFYLAEFNLHPNPSKGEFIINGGNDIIGKKITISDISGRILYTNKIESKQESFNLNHIGKGTFIVSINNHKRTKLVIH